MMQNLTTLRRALDESPENMRLWLLYGQSCLTSNDLNEARRAFERAELLAPGNPEARLGIASVFFREGRLSEAAVRTQSLLQHHYNFAPAHLLYSRIMLAEDERDSAEDHYATAKMLSKSLKDRDLERELVRQRRPAPPLDNGNDRTRLLGPWDSPDNVEEETGDFDSAGLEPEEFECFEEEAFSIEDFERPKGSFGDIAGLESVKDELRMKLVHPYEHPDIFRAYGKKAGGGVLLHGPPGCGKSVLCRAFAGETDAAFYTLRLHQILEVYAGCSEKNLHALFQTARERAPSVIFIDELDALGPDRSDSNQGSTRTIINQLLVELDGYDGSNEGVLVLAATSAIWNVDPAFLRPGRFGRRLFVPPPDRAEREMILRMNADRCPTNNLDFASLSARLDDFSGADIAEVFDVAIEDVLRLAMRKREVVPLTTEALVKAIGKVNPSIPLWRHHERLRWKT